MTDPLPFDRDALVDYGLNPSIEWDVIVIGGGATGLGTAVDAAARGYHTLLLEQHDFGKGTSSRSTKLIHGGVRYLQQGNVSLVFEALRERGRLLNNAPHLVRTIPFVVPCYKWWERQYYGFGLKLYQVMSGRLSVGPSSVLGRDMALNLLPNAAGEGMRGGVRYYDAQFDDARLIINLAQTCADLGAVPLNYVRATGLLRRDGRIRGVVAEDVENAREVELKARVVVNASGVFADGVRRMDDPQCPPIIRPSQGIHVVVGRSFLPGDAAMMIPRTDDGRVLFVIPWHDRTILGSTDTPVDSIDAEPDVRSSDVDFLLEHVARYLKVAPERQDVLSIFAGLRPLVAAGRTEDTKAISRDHVLRVSSSGLVTITGGKWATYRKMAQDTVDYAAKVAGLDQRPSPTPTLPIHGARVWNRS
ncbi:MAG: glycerol-3-phosphate dehydrogenase/oxidase, partial [Rhodothermales bacterium]|nr:glycerol-3-phosphate dehydrogenase/oxidase [Rhodothermales bacterium]